MVPRSATLSATYGTLPSMCRLLARCLWTSPRREASAMYHSAEDRSSDSMQGNPPQRTKAQKVHQMGSTEIYVYDITWSCWRSKDLHSEQHDSESHATAVPGRCFKHMVRLTILLPTCSRLPYLYLPLPSCFHL